MLVVPANIFFEAFLLKYWIKNKDIKFLCYISLGTYVKLSKLLKKPKYTEKLINNFHISSVNFSGISLTLGKVGVLTDASFVWVSIHKRSKLFYTILCLFTMHSKRARSISTKFCIVTQVDPGKVLISQCFSSS